MRRPNEVDFNLIQSTAFIPHLKIVDPTSPHETLPALWQANRFSRFSVNPT
jgi:hypothetical protein